MKKNGNRALKKCTFEYNNVIITFAETEKNVCDGRECKNDE